MTVARLCRTCLLIVLGASLVACSGSGKRIESPAATAIDRNAPSIRPTLEDGAPSYLMDVSGIPDAVPTPHDGAYKATPYTLMGVRYEPLQDGRNYREEGIASWYGTKFHGQLTANGEVYDLYAMTAAHKTLPLPSYVKVTNLENNREVIVRVNDRGPFYSERIIDLSYAAAQRLGFADKGTARVLVEGIDPVAWQQENNRDRQLVDAALDNVPASNGELYLQLGAFSNSQAAEQLRQRVQAMVSASVSVSPVQLQRQTLHRVRVGPVASEAEAVRLMDRLRLADLGSPTLIRAN
ncbi:septal ring lytic transglycosylase RlpA family protein [Halopseudomonas salegens]|uniref:Endolytic peptidoglycan transglycosylase RlpA n=1 Tax=Halopseudomonas salegens TaxID=1434072 RepID=A0A1H2GGD9_9GAMM|nr:septal ring lytic transglycosylase RlpA family protein [Halopseudomonas salegens]SDU18640.1 rare lipoprotein A [Halopseudomonas salegens]